ncbi:group II intron maturase-specific domain-containing protein [Nonomuraea endophytica]|uniref:group II intron maturase-specific domain-containing protein n=1 Tax=Nonomuraea endophytica TaxID=714136 RepID=UPI0037C6B071
MSRARDQRRAEERQERRERITAAMTGCLPKLDQAAAEQTLAEAGAEQGIALRALDEHPTAQPDALTSADPECPAVLMRLAHVLRAAGIHTEPGSPSSHQTDQPLCLASVVSTAGALVARLNPIIRGRAAYYRWVVASRIFDKLGSYL